MRRQIDLSIFSRGVLIWSGSKEGEGGVMNVDRETSDSDDIDAQVEFVADGIGVWRGVD